MRSLLAGLAEGLLGGSVGVATGRERGDVYRLLVAPHDLVEGPVELCVCGSGGVSVRTVPNHSPDHRAEGAGGAGRVGVHRARVTEWAATQGEAAAKMSQGS